MPSPSNVVLVHKHVILIGVDDVSLVLAAQLAKGFVHVLCGYCSRAVHHVRHPYVSSHNKQRHGGSYRRQIFYYLAYIYYQEMKAFV